MCLRGVRARRAARASGTWPALVRPRATRTRRAPTTRAVPGRFVRRGRAFPPPHVRVRHGRGAGECRTGTGSARGAKSRTPHGNRAGTRGAGAEDALTREGDIKNGVSVAHPRKNVRPVLLLRHARVDEADVSLLVRHRLHRPQQPPHKKRARRQRVRARGHGPHCTLPAALSRRARGGMAATGARATRAGNRVTQPETRGCAPQQPAGTRLTARGGLHTRSPACLDWAKSRLKGGEPKSRPLSMA